MESIIIVQHCQSEQHINNMCGGWTNWPLTNLGEKQAFLVGKRLSEHFNINDYILYSSDLIRASKTAEILGKAINKAPILNECLREINVGIATGKSRQWFLENALSVPKKDSRIDFKVIDGAETRRDVYNRVIGFLDHLEDLNIKKAILVTHGFALNMIIAWWLKLPAQTFNKSQFESVPGGITFLETDSDGFKVLKSIGERDHLNLA